ncbi:MAG: hypothetical protein E7Z79_00740 [Methanobrevibacter thaueri]|uniref:Adhesin-like protein n=1 Tax=Methanobrevibacter thaueri TaxID=190975 RepID=A0A8T3VEC4_9EURY|nr:hypothetical protein [Methanobrevibacter thaueri]MBE6500948.1 hypothetical protein [Methanobrevibacter thaueri]
MENKNIIIILVAIVIVLAVIAGAMFMQSINAKEPTKIKITSDKEQNEGGKLKIQLTDLNKTALSKEKVKIVVKNKKGKVVVNETVKTNSKGKAKLDLDLKKGKYVVNVTYGGNDNYTGNSASQKLKIKEETKESDNNKNSVDTSVYSEYSPYFGNYRTVETQQELALIETSNGEYYVFAGDGAYTYGGHDSQGHIELGSYAGKY